MKVFSDKVKYSILALFELAKNYSNKYIQIKLIATNQNIPQNYLEQLLVILKRSGIVESMRGSQGGYRLKKQIDNIRVIDIVEALEGPITILDYTNAPDALQGFWGDVEKSFKEQLHETLDQLLTRENASTYHI